MNPDSDNLAECVSCGCVMDVSLIQPFTNVECPECGKHNRVKSHIGSYVLKKRQGVGGMSIVFGAVDQTLGREVAIKILNESYSMDEKRIAQFEQEAKITAAISHPHVVRVYTVGQAYQRFYIAMELLPADSLEQIMSSEGAIPERNVLNWGRQICEGLNAANEAGLIHRDIKPGNILFDAEGNVKIVDFGLALVTQGGKAQAEEIWATPYYVPPETLDGREEDFRSDIYALGATLYHALTGVPPFENESRSTTELKQIKMRLPSIKVVAPWLSESTCTIIDKAMAFDPEERYSSYKDIIEALNRAELRLDDKPEVNHIEQTPLKKSGGKVKLYGIISVCVLAVGGIIFALNSGDNKDDGDNDSASRSLGIEGSDDGGVAGRSLENAIQEGRSALKKKDFKAAGSRYSSIVSDSRFSINPVMWGGLQSAIVNWLDGNPGEAKNQLAKVSKRYEEAKNRNQLEEGSEIISGLAKSIPLLLKMDRIDSGLVSKIQTEVEAMLVYASALKNWEEGYTDDTEKLLGVVQGFAEQSKDLSPEFKVYVSLIPDYNSDAAIMRPFTEAFTPTNDAEIGERRSKLLAAKSQIKTKGRAVENFEEWLIQLDLHKNRLDYEIKLLAEKEAEKQAQTGDDWVEFHEDLKKDLETSNFLIVKEKLKLRTFKQAETNKKKDHLIYLCDKAYGYIGTLSETLSKGVIQSEVKLKNGKNYSNFSGIEIRGIAVRERDGWVRVSWGEIETNSVVNFHTISMASSGDKLSQFEKDFRLEQAIAYAWLGGEKAKAKTAAANLSKTNQRFKDRWEECVKLLE